MEAVPESLHKRRKKRASLIKRLKKKVQELQRQVSELKREKPKRIREENEESTSDSDSDRCETCGWTLFDYEVIKIKKSGHHSLAEVCRRCRVPTGNEWS